MWSSLLTSCHVQALAREALRELGFKAGDSALQGCSALLGRLVEDEVVLQKILDRNCLVAAVVSCFICWLFETASLLRLDSKGCCFFSTAGLHHVLSFCTVTRYFWYAASKRITLPLDRCLAPVEFQVDIGQELLPSGA